MPAGRYNLTDGHPRTQGELGEAIAAGADGALHPLFDLRWGHGSLFGRSRRADDTAFASVTGWRPAFTDSADRLADLSRTAMARRTSPVFAPDAEIGGRAAELRVPFATASRNLCQACRALTVALGSGLLPAFSLIGSFGEHLAKDNDATSTGSTMTVHNGQLRSHAQENALSSV